jgi:hypothetical protein
MIKIIGVAAAGVVVSLAVSGGVFRHIGWDASLLGVREAVERDEAVLYEPAGAPAEDAAPRPVVEPLPAVAAPEVPTEAVAPAHDAAGDDGRVEARRVAAALDQEVDDMQRRVSRTFAAMKPRAAAEVLAYLSDDVARGVLVHLQPRDAAALLSALPAERAARLAGPLLPTYSPPSR